MMRFFFDYTTKDQSLFDYRGDEFRTPQAAIDFAGAIAEDLKHSLNDNWMGWSIEVRDALGMKFFSVPVETAGLVAA
jgi:hypothetical protein